MAERTKLKQARQRKHWSQDEAAGRAGVDPGTYRKWEKGTATPRVSSIALLCQAFELDAASLGLVEESVDILPVTSGAGLLTGNDLLMRLLSVAFLPLSYQVAQRQIAVILEEHDSMKHTEKTPSAMNRRTALTYLASLPFVASLRPTQSAQRVEEILMQCNAGVAACWALSKSKEESDLALAYSGAAEYGSALKPIIKQVTSLQQRKAIAELVTQVEMLQTVLGWHRINPLVAVQHGNEAVRYGEIAGDAILQINALKLLTWAYYYGQDRQGAIRCMQKAQLLAQEHHIPPHAQSGLECTLAIAQAYNEVSPVPALSRAERGVLSTVDTPDYQMDPIAAHFTKAGLALYLQRDYSQAKEMLSQVVDPETLALKHPLPERFRVEALNLMVLSELKSKEKDKERIKRYWQVAMDGTLHMQSKQRFNEAALSYGIMEALWPEDQEITEKFRSLVTGHFH